MNSNYKTLRCGDITLSYIPMPGWDMPWREYYTDILKELQGIENKDRLYELLHSEDTDAFELATILINNYRKTLEK